MAWDGTTFDGKPELYTDVLSESDVEEIRKAISHFKDHIRHERKDESTDANLRPTELPVAMEFHTDADGGAILALFTEKTAKSGGEQYLSSFWRVYNSIAQENPDALSILAADWHWEKPDRGRINMDNVVLDQRAIIGQVNGRVQINYGRSFVAGHERYPLTSQAPPLTTGQRAALDLLKDRANAHGFQLDTQPGDLLFVNNLSIMHGRGAFRDDDDSGHVRHVIRLWLQDHMSWPIAPSLKYKINPEIWDVPPEEQRLLTLNEWQSMPRAIRAANTGTTLTHD
ncbi:hypothetical protein K4K59_008604 [Colletotrichum sp. SAR11_240]|nr:hypothetical protein K4K59_008604 [Colletotrichum sp. SAR11_240]